MKVVELQAIKDVVLIYPDVHGDARGSFSEVYRRSWLPVGREAVQANISEKSAGCVVGMHYHFHQADYWIPLKGRFQIVLYDLREGCPTKGNLYAFDTDEENRLCVFIPPGVAHGFASLTEATLLYLVDGYYNPADELGFSWKDPVLEGVWKVDEPVISSRDQAAPVLSELAPEKLPRYPLRT